MITTLAGHAYQGEGDLYGSLLGVLDRIASWTNRDPGQVLEVRNPTNEKELFSESWLEKPQSYQAFGRWVGTFRDRVTRLPQLSGAALDIELDQLFGENVMQAARVEFGRQLQAERGAKRLRYSGGALTTASGAGAAIPTHNFYGSDEE